MSEGNCANNSLHKQSACLNWRQFQRCRYKKRSLYMLHSTTFQRVCCGRFICYFTGAFSLQFCWNMGQQLFPNRMGNLIIVINIPVSNWTSSLNWVLFYKFTSLYSTDKGRYLQVNHDVHNCQSRFLIWALLLTTQITIGYECERPFEAVMKQSILTKGGNVIVRCLEVKMVIRTVQKMRRYFKCSGS